MTKKNRMQKWIYGVAGLIVFIGCFILFIYSPYYSKMMVSILNHIVNVEVNQTAAQSQKMAALSEEETYEPGSEMWIARQAYLRLMEESIKSDDPNKNLANIQIRYQQLQKEIEQQQENIKADKPEVKIPIVLGDMNVKPAEVASDPLTNYLSLEDENKELIEQYIEYLKKPIQAADLKTSEVIDEQKLKEQALQTSHSEKQVLDDRSPHAIVVLGGGLTVGDQSDQIVVNKYTKLRLEKTLDVLQQYPLPIVLSGVEAPYMQKWLEGYQVNANLLENKSMNTCENSRFSSLLLQKKGGAPTVILITDRYHMPRTRRLFALNGIETIPVEAPLPTELTQWKPSSQNYDHSRRANYELLATLRDLWFGLSDCREIP